MRKHKWMHGMAWLAMSLASGTGCREGGRRDRADNTDSMEATDSTAEATDSESDVASPDVGADTAPAGDTQGADSGPVEAPTAINGCAESDLEACDYPERGLNVTVREGLSITDPVTGRVLPLLVRVPEGPGPFPLVIWSHGGGANNAGQRFSPEWGDAFATQGYAVIHVAHVVPTEETARKICDTANVPASECTASEDEDTNGLLALFKTADISAVIEQLPALSQASVSAGGPAIDLDRVAVAGWSGGARAPSVLAGTVVNTTENGDRLDRRDERVKAVIMLSPAGPGFGGYFDDGTENSWQSVKSPILWMTGLNDLKENKPGLTGPVRRHGFAKLPADGTHWLLYSNLEVGVGGHVTFNLEDAASDDVRLSRLSRALRSSALAYLDAMLKDDPDGKAWMNSANAKILAGDADSEKR